MLPMLLIFISFLILQWNSRNVNVILFLFSSFEKNEFSHKFVNIKFSLLLRRTLIFVRHNSPIDDNRLFVKTQ